MARCDNCLANKVCDHHRFGFENCGSYISAADVAPKSEVAREIEKFEQQVGKIYNRYVFEDTDYADDDVAIEAVINALTDVLNDLADFKKKYTEERE